MLIAIFFALEDREVKPILVNWTAPVGIEDVRLAERAPALPPEASMQKSACQRSTPPAPRRLNQS
jgi:hypothetical protein